MMLFPAIIVLKLLCEGVLRVEISDELLERFYLQLECFGSFEVFTINCFTLALIEHIHIASDKL